MDSENAMKFRFVSENDIPWLQCRGSTTETSAANEHSFI